jgi:adenylate kinase
MMRVNRHIALLLLGPTGSGKTPLGQMLEARGLCGTKCVHFDFGENLRQLVAHNRPDDAISSDDIEFLRGVLATGALLEDRHFPLAQRILGSFLAHRPMDDETVVVLNGLPRHVGQAQAIDTILDVRRVLWLECSVEAVALRLANNIGGDRGDRPDDQADQVRKRLAVFEQQTAPLVEYYRQRGVTIETLQIAADTTPEQAWATLQRLPDAALSPPRECGRSCLR